MSSREAPTPPAPEEIEVSVFGRGVGECVVVHGGDGRWMIVDSCTVPGVRPAVPVALQYLHDIGVDPAAVRLLVATHWDDDHIGGMATLHRECVNATFVCSAALNTRDFPSFVLEQELANIAEGSGVDEFREILRDRADDDLGEPQWGMWNRDLLESRDPFQLDVWALSPSSEAVGRGFAMAAYRAAGIEPMRRAADPGPNEGSVVLWVRAGEVRVLLGADLVEVGPDRRGWTAILHGKPQRWLADGKAHLFKVSHHGSKNARHERIWTELLESEPTAVVTSHIGGANPPPSEEERAWIHERASDSSFITTLRSGRRRRRSNEIERAVKAAGKKLRVDRGLGQIRARCDAAGSGWAVTCFGDATRLP